MSPGGSTLRGRKALWRVEDRLPQEIREALDGYSVMLSHLLYCRGYRTVEEIGTFFDGVSIAHDAFLLPDMEEAVARISQAVQSGERVGIYGDFDCDGITSTAVLVSTLRGLGIEPIVCIPTREDGHGLHLEALADLNDQGVSLLITGDCGVSAVEEVRVARAMGMDVIVTDHHEARADGSLPDCLVIAPTRHDALYPCRFLCGVGLAYKLAQALAARLPGASNPDDLLDLVALGTIADIVPLRDENRTLVTRGLARLRETSRPGLVALFGAAGVDRKKIDPTAVGYYLAPRINAANRMATPQLAYDLITATDDRVAADLAKVLSEHNQQRQLLVAQYTEHIAEQIGAPADIAEEIREGRRAPVLIEIGDWPRGISGLLASKLVDAYGLPAFVGTESSAGIISVSARSIPGVSVDEILERCEASLPGGIFLGYGGHAGAGGFSVHGDMLDVALNLVREEAIRQVQLDEIGAVLTVDAEVPLDVLTLRAAEQVQSLAPFGVGFPEPLFLTRRVKVQSIRSLRSNKHVRARLAQGSAYRDAVMFNAPPDFAQLPRGTEVDIVYHLGINDWDGLSRQELRIRDWRPSL